MIASNPDSLQLLKKANLRCTNVRLMILDTLSSAGSALTQQEISESLPELINKVTIYRTLETFSRAGITHKVFLMDRTWHFELSSKCSASHCHPHFTCRICQKTFCFENSESSFPIAPSNFDIQHQKVLLEGLCPSCRNKSSKNLNTGNI